MQEFLEIGVLLCERGVHVVQLKCNAGRMYFQTDIEEDTYLFAYDQWNAQYLRWTCSVDEAENVDGAAFESLEELLNVV